MEKITLLETYTQFQESRVGQPNPRLLDNLRTALKHCVLPFYATYSPAELRSNFEECLAQVPLSQLLKDASHLLDTLSKGIILSSSRTVSTGTINNYQSALLRFFRWIYANRWDDPIETDSLPTYAPQISSGQTLSKTRQPRQQLHEQPYKLKDEELTPKLEMQLSQLHDFWTTPDYPARKTRPLREPTFRTYGNSILCILGWQQNIQAKDLNQLSLEQVTDLEQLKTFIQWGEQQRGNKTGWAINITQAAICVAKWWASQSHPENQSSTIVSLQQYSQTLHHQYSNRETIDSQAITFEESIQVVEYLKQCCAPLHKSGSPRAETALLKAWQRYLIVALLVYSPLRQSEIRALEWTCSLYREKDGYWVRLHSSKFSLPNESSPSEDLRLPTHLTEDLDKWIEEFRAKIDTEHGYVFIRTGSGREAKTLGKPLGAHDLSTLVSTAIYKATSVLFESPKRGTPHVLRRNFATYLGRLEERAEAPKFQS